MRHHRVMSTVYNIYDHLNSTNSLVSSVYVTDTPLHIYRVCHFVIV